MTVQVLDNSSHLMYLYINAYEFLSLIQFLRSIKFIFPNDLWTYMYRACLEGVAWGVKSSQFEVNDCPSFRNCTECEEISFYTSYKANDR